MVIVIGFVIDLNCLDMLLLEPFTLTRSLTRPIQMALIIFNSQIEDNPIKFEIHKTF